MKQKKYFARKIVLLCFSLILAGCATSTIIDEKGVDLVGKSGVYTLVNLHPDEARARLYATNYQQSGFIPLCTEVKISKTSRKVMTFMDLSTKKQYQYYYHKSAVEPLAVHLLKYFGEACKKDKVAKLSELDQEGIQLGVVKKGMSKEGVILAIGYPPKHRTPSLEADLWIYWQNRWATMRVDFENNKVSHIKR